MEENTCKKDDTCTGFQLQGDMDPPLLIQTQPSDERDKLKMEKGSVKGYCSYLKLRGYWNPLVKSITFLIHFLLVVASLFGGAMFLAMIEDPIMPLRTDALDQNDTFANVTKITINSTIQSSRTKSADNESYLWQQLQKEFNITLNADSRNLMINKFKSFIIEEEKRSEQIAYERKHQDRKFVFLKWFYFVTITTTTIGYGDVSPKTENGKLFCSIFLIFGIILMMTLLKSCGEIIAITNRKCYGLIIHHLCRRESFVSEELISIISIIIIFICFMFVGIWYENTHDNADWPLIDVVYFWIVTFTTVGYGDFTYPLEIETRYIFQRVVFRLFGLSFLAGIIEAIQAYLKVRKQIPMTRQNVYELQQ